MEDISYCKHLYEGVKEILNSEGYTVVNDINEGESLYVIETNYCEELLNNELVKVVFEFNGKFNMLDLRFSIAINVLDEMSLYRKINETNMLIEDGIIVYYENNLIYRYVLDLSKVKSAQSLFNWQDSLQALASGLLAYVLVSIQNC